MHTLPDAVPPATPIMNGRVGLGRLSRDGSAAPLPPMVAVDMCCNASMHALLEGSSSTPSP